MIPSLRGVTVVILVTAASACGSPSAPVPSASSSRVLPPPQFVGRQACESCHEAEAKSWRGSDHDRAMDVATEATVLGDFSGATFTHFGVTSTFTKKDGKFFVRTDGPDGKLHDYEIAYTFGVNPLQQYLIRFPEGRIQALNVCWDTRPKEQGGQRWFHLYPKEAVPFDDVLHWTGIYQNWNHMCAECHSTNVKKGYNAEKRSYDTTWSEIDVSCEACHGPGSNHDAWARARPATNSTDNDPNLGLAVRLKESERAQWVMDTQTGIAKRNRPRNSHEEIETCGRCHARRGVVAGEYVYGRPLMDSHRVALLTPSLYYADGQILDEDYEYGSFRQSKMYAAGVTCTDCHDPHTGKAPQGNAACAPCHLPSKFDTALHHHHKTDGPGAQCVSCHMPTRNYMVVDARHDHSFKVPRPHVAGAVGAPNACSGCHAGKSLGWAIAAYANWWEDRRPFGWSVTIADGRKDPQAAAPELAALLADEGEPAIVRATAAELSEPAGQEALTSLIGVLADPDPLVRNAAIQTLSQTDPGLRAKVLAPLTQDPVRTVRIDAGRALAGAAAAQLPPPQARQAAEALAEWRASQYVDADRPEARLNLCALDAELGDFANAAVECHEALKLAPKIPGPYVNLADVQRSQGREDAARATLREGLKAVPDSAVLWYALGLALVRQHRPGEALEALKKATELEPDNRRFAQVYEIARKEYDPGGNK